MAFPDIAALRAACDGVLAIRDDGVDLLDAERLRNDLTDRLLDTTTGDDDLSDCARWLIRRAAAAAGIFPASLAPVYADPARSAFFGVLLPAIALAPLPAVAAQAAFRAARRLSVGLPIFALTRADVEASGLRLQACSNAVLAAALKAGYAGPVLLQGLFDLSAEKYADDPEGEEAALKDLVWEALEAGFYNLDIDASPLGRSAATPASREKANAGFTAAMTVMIRDLEPLDLSVAVGGRLGRADEADRKAFLAAYAAALKKGAPGEDPAGLSVLGMPDFDEAGAMAQLAEAALREGGTAGLALTDRPAALPSGAVYRILVPWQDAAAADSLAAPTADKLAALGDRMEGRFALLFEQCRMTNTAAAAARAVPITETPLRAPAALRG